MCHSLLPLLLCFCFFQLILTYEDHRFKNCGSSTSTTYTANSTFSSNLQEAFNRFKNNTALTILNSTIYTIINGTDPVTVLALCRVDISAVECQPCIEAATIGIVEECPYHSSAEIWYSLCMIRYSGENFITKPDYTVVLTIWDVRDVPQPDIYDKKVQEVAQNLSISAGKSEERFAVGWTNVSSTLRLQGYHVCTRDLSSEDCTYCLRNARRTIQRYCLGKWACWIATPSCDIRLNLDPVVFNETRMFAPQIITNYVVTDPIPSPRILNVRNARSENGLIIGVTVGGFVIIVIMVIGSLWLRDIDGKKKKKNKMERRVSRDAQEDDDGETTIIDIVESGSFVFHFEMLVVATENFSLANRLGTGGFGSVYKGKIGNYGQEIAVKKLAVGSNQGVEEFSNEVMLLLRMQHRNLVKLLGCCIQGEEKMLVYEYLHNKSLDCFLFDKSKSALLDWPKRFNIIAGIARGLLYLHEDSQVRIIHRDIKASNILLDEQMNPKISDFGLARLFPDEISQLRTRRIAGTFGYMAPEYAVRGLLSAKSDVFSFGVVILEIISGRKNYDSQLDEPEQELLNLVSSSNAYIYRFLFIIPINVHAYSSIIDQHSNVNHVADLDAERNWEVNGNDRCDYWFISSTRSIEVHTNRIVMLSGEYTR
ncbi:hypothetical protein AQUCO_04100021v1 [Aquilegia coerulea]|uniref:Protein kinase domain-containing protein n=1 Tax=Aquilegia coerulea TaxID=218851 RepID=A0A2G5CPY8_AQUCA|nr:hypothetical protein AQUCO_04100021v1 [Aquilegia coerulea]